MAVEFIVAAIDAKYVEELKEEYVGYKKEIIKKIVTHIRTWYVITTKEKLAIKDHFLAPHKGTSILLRANWTGNK